MIVLVDTDVLVDVALRREPHAPASIALLILSNAAPRPASSPGTAFRTSTISFAPNRGSHGAREFLRDLLRFVDVAQTSTASAAWAAGLPMRDFEDALQVAAAAACAADVIATRNIRDYAKSPVPADTPAGILRRMR